MLSVLKDYPEVVSKITDDTVKHLYTTMVLKNIDLDLLEEVFPNHTFELSNDVLYNKFLDDEDMNLLYRMNTPLSLEDSTNVISNIYLLRHSDDYISLFKKGILNKDSQYQGSGLPNPVSVLTYLVIYKETGAGSREIPEITKVMNYIIKNNPDAVKKTSSELEKLKSFHSVMPKVIDTFNTEFVEK